MEDRSENIDGQKAVAVKKTGRNFAGKRQRAEALLAAQRQRVEQVEAHLGTQLRELSESALQEINDRFRSEREALDRRAAELGEHSRDLDRRWEEQAAAEQRLVARQEEFTRRDEQIAKLQHELTDSQQRSGRQHQQASEQLRRDQDDLARQRHELELAQDQLHQARRALKRADEERDLEADDLSRRRERIVDLETRLTRQSEELELRREQTRNQRRRIANELQAQRVAQQHEVETLRRKLDSLQSNHQRACQEETGQMDQQRRELQRKLDQQEQEFHSVRAALEQKTAALERRQAELDQRERALMQQPTGEVQASSVEVQRLQIEIERLTGEVDGWTAEVDRLSAELVKAQAQVMTLSNRPVEDDSKSAEWDAERESLLQRLAKAEANLQNTDAQTLADYQRRFELAIEDVRSLKRAKSELEEEVAALKASGMVRSSAISDGGDWESQKRKLLASLESDDRGGAPSEKDRLTIESTIQITDEVVAQKDIEIAELKRILEHQSDNIGSVSIGAAAIAEMLDQDELIKQEREKLIKLQEEWRDKVRQSEIDISIERARVARQRAELDDKVSNYESERARQSPENDAAGSSDATKRPARGRWLARLGLKDDGV